jgi:hypothetical protein
MKQPAVIVLILMASTLVIFATASAQERHSTLPWFMITIRPEIGSGSGKVDLNWNSVGGFADYEEKPAIQGAGWGGLAIEPFFMPTKGRQFIVSPLLSFGRGSGKFSNEGPIVDGQDMTYSQWVLAVGLGYQWYFGATQATNLYLMGHFGGGRITLAVDENGWESSDPMALWYLDVTIGSMHRWENGFLLGGALILNGESFSGSTGAGDFWDVEATGNIQMWRLGLMLGYAMK